MKHKKIANGLHVKQQKRTTLVVLVCLMVLLGAGWVFFKPEKNNVRQVVSLKETWTLLENSARDWQDDAYLTNVSFYLTREIIDSSAFKIGAEFHSSHVPSDEMLFVGVTNSGKVVNRPIDMMPGQTTEPQSDEITVSIGSSAEKPIYQGEWSIDSQDALDIFAKDQEVSLCFNSPKASIELSLNKVHTEYPAWELTILSCPEKDSFKSYYLSAKTGELFDPFTP
ncbi:MAG: hypothetical protein HY869_03665 [Chloroflexi bacterium]|nr:hypothetical protein [Chloroflexota bacterium]